VEKGKLVICSATHKCKPRRECKHNVQHEYDPHHCGQHFMPCSDGQPEKHISACVPVKDGKYGEVERDWCPHCRGTGVLSEKIRWRDAPERTDSETVPE